MQIARAASVRVRPEVGRVSCAVWRAHFGPETPQNNRLLISQMELNDFSHRRLGRSFISEGRPVRGGADPGPSYVNTRTVLIIEAILCSRYGHIHLRKQ